MKKLFLLLTIALAHTAVKGQSKIEKYLDEIVKLKSFSGSIVVSSQDEVVLQKGFGYADYENRIPNSDTTVHRIGSLTKQFTAMAVIKLVSDSIPLDSPISEFIDEVPDSWNEVTIYQLLTHTSNIPDLFGEMKAVPVEDTYAEINKVLKDDPELVDSGNSYRYNNFGYILLGRFIEIVSGTSYFEFIKENILIPLNMTSTYYDDPRQIIKNRAEGYKLKEGLRKNDALKDPAAYSAGGMLSTSSDLLKFSKALNSDVILSETQRELMFTPHQQDYGLGWQIVIKNGETMYNHNGGTHGFNARMVYYPKSDIFIAILGNNEDVRAAAITCDIEVLVFNTDSHALSLPTEIKAEKLSRYQGDYISENNQRSISLRNDGWYYINGDSEFKLSPLSTTEFCFEQYEDIRIRFLNQSEFEISTCSLNPTVYKKK